MGRALLNIEAAELRDDYCLLARFIRACREGVLQHCPADALAFFGAAEYVLAANATRPGALFRWIVEGRRFGFIKEHQDERARQRLLNLRRSAGTARRARALGPAQLGGRAGAAAGEGREPMASAPSLARVLPSILAQLVPPAGGRFAGPHPPGAAAARAQGT